MTTGIQCRAAEFLLLQVCPPGGRPENAGVLLLDGESGELQWRFRRDWEEVADTEDLDVLLELDGMISAWERDLGGAGVLAQLGDASGFLRVGERRAVGVHSLTGSLNRLYRENVQPKVLPFRTHLPQFSARAAAGKFGEHMEVEEEGWTEAPAGLRLTEDMFAAHVTGRSMLPVIPDGALCAFRAFGAGSRQGKLVLVMNYGETGENRFTVKRYRSSKRTTGDDAWEHEEIRLEPLNPEFESWTLEEGSNVRVIAEFVQVIEEEEPR